MRADLTAYGTSGTECTLEVERAGGDVDVVMRDDERVVGRLRLHWANAADLAEALIAAAADPPPDAARPRKGGKP